MLGLILLAGKRAVVSRQMAHTMYYKLGNKRPVLMCAGKREWARAGCERRDAATKQEGGVVGLRIQIRTTRARRFRKICYDNLQDRPLQAPALPYTLQSPDPCFCVRDAGMIVSDSWSAKLMG